MSLEYYTARFATDSRGIAKKDDYSQAMASQGWKITSEVIEQGHIRGDQACCVAAICLPLILMAGRTPNVVIVTYSRDRPSTAVSALKICAMCGAGLEPNAKFCSSCGRLVPTDGELSNS
jgi:hypothetical protein